MADNILSDASEKYARRFWKYVDKTGDCWVWTGAKVPHGYGQFEYQGQCARSHRVAWYLAHGYFPKSSECILHRCDNRACVRIDHLWLGTQQENVADMMAKKRNGYKSFPGEKHGRTKLSNADVKEIRKLLSEGCRCVDVAAMYGVTKNVISRINTRKTWSFLE